MTPEEKALRHYNLPVELDDHERARLSSMGIDPDQRGFEAMVSELGDYIFLNWMIDKPLIPGLGIDAQYELARIILRGGWRKL